ncbi:hypothetical protein LTR53_000095 [Teratosphaeriaceae sp. CCFEE 6253]|nr:hypothetical protein LTR53_000095 [Teratosphaeriaceae sp. CCFEE 6253]
MTSPYDFAVMLPPNDLQGFPGVPVAPEMVAAVLNAGPPPSQPDLDEEHFRTLLQPPHPELDQAIESGSADRVLDELAKARRRFSPEATFNTAIERAIACGRFDIMRLLIDNGVPVNINNLEAAAQSGHIPILEYLMKYFSWPIDCISDHGSTILTLAVEHQDVVAWLLSEGADIDKEDAYSETPLSRAVQKESKGVVKMLLEAGADVTRGAPLQASLLRKEGNANLELTKELLTHGAHVNKFVGEGSPVWERAGFEQMTALQLACDGSHRNLAAVRLLLAYGADLRLNRRLLNGELLNTSAFVSAQGRGYTDIVSVMQEHVKESDGSSKSNL